MNILEYLQLKMNTQTPSSILKAERLIFGMNRKLNSGWLGEVGSTVITEDMSLRLRQLFTRYPKLPNAKLALEILGGNLTPDELQKLIPLNREDQVRANKAINDANEIVKFKRRLKLTKRNTKQPTELTVTKIIKKSGIDPTLDSFLNTFEWKAIRKMALNLYGSRCQCCGASPSTGAVMNVDHIKSRKFYPHLALDINNLQVLCGDCNEGKGNWDMTDHRT